MEDVEGHWVEINGVLHWVVADDDVLEGLVHVEVVDVVEEVLVHIFDLLVIDELLSVESAGGVGAESVVNG